MAPNPSIVPFMMSLDDFWRRIDEAKKIHQTHGIRPHEALALRLSLDSVAMVASFEERFFDLSQQAKRKDIHNVLGGSDDGFTDNISEVISLGRSAYESLIHNPGAFGHSISGYETFAYASQDAAHPAQRDALRSKALALFEANLLEDIISAPPSSPGPGLRL